MAPPPRCGRTVDYNNVPQFQQIKADKMENLPTISWLVNEIRLTYITGIGKNYSLAIESSISFHSPPFGNCIDRDLVWGIRVERDNRSKSVFSRSTPSTDTTHLPWAARSSRYQEMLLSQTSSASTPDQQPESQNLPKTASQAFGLLRATLRRMLQALLIYLPWPAKKAQK